VRARFVNVDVGDTLDAVVARDLKSRRDMKNEPLNADRPRCDRERMRNLSDRLTVSLPSVLAFVALGVAITACNGAVAPSDAGSEIATNDVAIGDASDTTSSGACVATARTCAEITASFASNSTNVTVTCDEAAGTFTVSSTGTPNYSSNQSTPNSIVDQMWVVTFPLQPACASSTTSVIASRGPIGFMINGVPFYGPQDANGNDAVVNEGPSFDDCEGHADQGCSYHYHEEPICVFGLNDTAAMHREADGHPAVIGYAFDGFAIHANYGSATPDAPLDECNGHTDATHGYHYHATATSPYLLGCYRGTRNAQVMQAMNLCVNGTPTDGGVTDSGTGGPRTCTTATDCTGACPPGSMGCTCANSPMGMISVPSCNSSTDCPTTSAGTMLMCDTTMHICHP
jgi:hypothetical protein